MTFVYQAYRGCIGYCSGVPTQRARRVLVVDDKLDSAEAFARVLETMGHDAAFVTDPRVAVRTAREHRSELVFLDIGMPELDGYQVAQRLRDEFGFEAMRIVAVTAYGGEEDRAHSRKAGIDAHVVKPIDVPVIEGILQTIFNPPPA
jgi:CheY-like chemotaxis protein